MCIINGQGVKYFFLSKAKEGPEIFHSEKIRKNLEKFGKIQNNSEKFREIWKILEQFGKVQKYLEKNAKINKRAGW